MNEFWKLISIAKENRSSNIPNKYEEQAAISRLKVREELKDIEKYKVCTSKRKYPSKTKARQKKQQPYHCPFCGGWHRTTQLQKLIVLLRKIVNRKKRKRKKR